MFGDTRRLGIGGGKSGACGPVAGDHVFTGRTMVDSTGDVRAHHDAFKKMHPGLLGARGTCRNGGNRKQHMLGYGAKFFLAVLAHIFQVLQRNPVQHGGNNHHANGYEQVQVAVEAGVLAFRRDAFLFNGFRAHSPRSISCLQQEDIRTASVCLGLGWLQQLVNGG